MKEREEGGFYLCGKWGNKIQVQKCNMVWGFDG